MATTNSLVGFQDILYDVIQHLASNLEVFDASYYESTDSRSVRQTLARLARVHSSLFRPALIALWRRLWDDRPLRHLLWVVGIARKTSPRCQWEIPPLEIRARPKFWPKSSWDRFQEYAFLVQEIILDPFVGSGTMDTPLQSKVWKDNFWCRLSSTVGNTPVLPNLGAASLLTPNSFKFRPFNKDVLCLLNPSIRELNIILPRANRDNDNDERKVREALSDCFSSFQNLQVLSVEIPICVLDLGALAQSHPRLHFLRFDTSFQANSNHIMRLAAFESLEYLSIDLSPQIHLKDPVTFARLRTLRVLSNELVALVAFLILMDAPQLRTVFVSEKHGDFSIMHRGLQEVLRTLVVKSPFLVAVEWESLQPNGMSRSESQPGATLAKLLDSLLCHPTIRSFSLNFMGSNLCYYTPDDFRAIAEAWPDLETFHLYEDGHLARGGYGDQYADAESLLAFARHCPNLRSLHIPAVKFGLESLGVAAEPHHGGLVVPHGLRDLWVTSAVVCSGEKDADCRRQGRAQFRPWVETVFPFAFIRIPC